MRKGYFGEPGQQIHFYESGDGLGTSLVCLAPAPHSGLYFAKLHEALANQPCISVDYPGYGGSDVQGCKTIEHYAARLVNLIEAKGPAHLLGFHSGCLVATELARTVPHLLDKILLIDVPLFDDTLRKKYAAKFANDLQTPQSSPDMEDHFTAEVIKRKEDFGITRAFDLWAESLRAGTRRNAIFQAAFAYELADVLENLDYPLHMIATQSFLLEATRKASKITKNASLIERTDIEKAVFDKFAGTLAAEINGILNS